MPKPRCLSIVLGAIIVGASPHVLAQAVHSAAGILPGEQIPSSHYVPATPPPSRYDTPSLNRSSPPLPSAGANSVAHLTRDTQSVPVAAPKPMSFEKALDEGVTIDVVDMSLEDFMEALTPYGWRLRFQNVSDAIKATRVDFTAQGVSRREVLYGVLGDASLSLQPFDSFDTPLLLVTSAE